MFNVVAVFANPQILRPKYLGERNKQNIMELVTVFI